jgi:hypothetical protein
MKYVIVLLTCLLALLASVACSQRASNASYKESVKKALEQADLKDVTVSEDAHKNTITLASFCRETRFYSKKSAFCKGIQSFEGAELAGLGGGEIICMYRVETFNQWENCF